MSPTARPAPTSSLWLVVLAIGLVIGVAATLLSGVFTPPGAPSGGTVVAPTNQLVGWVLILLTFGLVLFFLYRRLRSGILAVPARLIAPTLIMILVLVIFVILVRVNLIGANPGPGLGGHGIGGNNTNTTPPPGGNGTAQNVSGPGTVHILNLSLPTWAAYALLGAVVIGVGAAAAVAAFRLARTAHRRPRGPPPSVAGLRSDLEIAARALDEPGDPREVLIQLYARLLHRLEPAVGDLATRTAGEIKTFYLVRLGVQLRTAEEVTRLFELARYSSHPIGPGEVTRARTVLNSAIEQLRTPRAA